LFFFRSSSIAPSSGHIAELTSGAWHPKDAKTFITSSADSTIRWDNLSQFIVGSAAAHCFPSLHRIWDVENKRKSKGVIVLKSKERGTRTKITACAYSSDGKSIAAGKESWESHFDILTTYGG
jgi:WD40 repeat protein